jgi:hypothetical protein
LSGTDASTDNADRDDRWSKTLSGLSKDGNEKTMERNLCVDEDGVYGVDPNGKMYITAPFVLDGLLVSSGQLKGQIQTSQTLLFALFM